MYFTNVGKPRQTTKHLRAEREGFEPPGLIGLPLSRRVHLSALPPFRDRGYRSGATLPE